MNSIWKSILPYKMKRNFFRATVESVLIYIYYIHKLCGFIFSWTLTKALEKKTQWKLYPNAECHPK